jgi:hypothetical protein
MRPTGKPSVKGGKKVRKMACEAPNGEVMGANEKERKIATPKPATPRDSDTKDGDTLPGWP